MYQYKCIINRIVDGDTVDVDIDLGFDQWMRHQRVRLSSIDAPEVRTRDLQEKAAGQAASEFLESLLPVGSEQTLVCTEYNRSGKYGRIIGTFAAYSAELDAWSDVSTMMLEQGHATKYQ